MTNIKIKIIFLFVIIVLSLFIYVACQPTPSKTAVANKNDGSLEQTISQQAKSVVPEYQYKAPEKWTETFASENQILNVNIDALINVPDVTKFPVYAVMPADITADQIKKYSDVLFQGKTAYNAKPIDLITQEDLINQTQEIMQYLADLKEADPEQYDKEASSWQTEIEKNNDRLNSLPPSYDYTPADFNFTSNQFNEMMLNLETDMGRDRMASLSFYKVESNKHNSIVFNNAYKDEWTEITLHDISQPKGSDITEDEAVKMGEDLINKLGIEDMGFDIAAIRPWNVHFPHVGPIPAREDRDMYYQLYYTRKLDGCNWTHTENGGLIYVLQKGPDDPAQYAEKWDDEYITVCVDKDGVFYFAYFNPAEIKNKLNDNTSLFPFDKIQELFKKQIEIQNSWTNAQGIESATIYIDSIKLGLAKIKEQNSDGYLLVPAWDFFGHYEVKYVNGYRDSENMDENNVFKEPTYYANSFLTINAIDGSIIDRYVGY